MTASTNTPGPWRVSPTKCRTLIVSDLGHHVASIDEAAPADARLIAQAAALAEALAWALDQIEDSLDPDHQEALAAARATLAAAIQE